MDDARIDRLLSRLRAKIEPDPQNPRYLIPVRGRGYKPVNPWAGGNCLPPREQDGIRRVFLRELCGKQIGRGIL